jgi:hypothetical protein
VGAELRRERCRLATAAAPRLTCNCHNLLYPDLMLFALLPAVRANASLLRLTGREPAAWDA